jgi:uncharacterized protein (TIGR00255 family)
VARSMTGFGAAEAATPTGRYAVEVRSLNHRFCEIVVRIPRDLAPLEDRVRALVQDRVLRGRVEVAIMRENYSKRPRTVKTDLELAQAYVSALNDLKRALSISGSLDLSVLLSLPEIVRVEEEKEDLEAAWPAIAEGVGAALDRLVAMRESEGAQLAADIHRRIDRLEGLMDEIAGRAPQVVEEYRDRLARRIAELAPGVAVDPGRLATEVAVFAERSDISEEITRFRSHLRQFRSTLGAPGAVGRTLDFIVQELGREINTIGSKANDLEIAQRVIAVKGELESLREQIQNLE